MTGLRNCETCKHEDDRKDRNPCVECLHNIEFTDNWEKKSE